MPIGPDDTATPRQGWIALACVFMLPHSSFLWRCDGERPFGSISHALVDHQSASIDPVLNELYPNYKESPAYQQKKWHPNIDASQFDGRDYMDKAPGLSLLVAPLYGLLSSLDFDGLRADWVLVSHLLLLFGVAFPALLGLLAVRQSIIYSAERPLQRGSALLPLDWQRLMRSTPLSFGHTLAAAQRRAELTLAIQKRPGWAEPWQEPWSWSTRPLPSWRWPWASVQATSSNSATSFAFPSCPLRVYPDRAWHLALR